MRLDHRRLVISVVRTVVGSVVGPSFLDAAVNV